MNLKSANGLMKYLSLLCFWVLCASVLGYGGIILTAVPAGMRKQNMDITIAWTGGAGRVHLRASTVPGGDLAPISHYDSLHLPSQMDAAIYTFRVNPDIPFLYRNTDLRFGVNYCIVTDGFSRSTEFIVLLESSSAPVLGAPSNAAVLKDLSPTFSWSGEAPYYTVLVSDEPFKISDSGTVTGVSAVWQIITPYSSARYGDADPSGYNSVAAPPLISGKTYNWLVLNNYGNNTASTSKVAPVPFSFVYAPSAPLAAPILLEPKDRDTVPGSDQILFRWALVDGAVSYKLELLEENIVEGSQADITLWKATSNGGQIVLNNASGLLRRYNYKWRVYAIGNNGSASLSEKRSFFYAIDVGNINIDLVNQAGQKVAYAPIKINRLGGSSSAVFQGGSTDEGGRLSVQNAPLGSYEASIENLPGYATKIDTLQHKLKSGTSKTIVLSPVLGKIFGKISTLGTGTGILNAKVTVIGSDGSQWNTATNSQGNYSFGLPYGNWQVRAQEASHSPSAAISASLNSTNPSKMVDINLEANKYTLSGTVTNSFTRQGIFGASLYLTSGAETRMQLSDGNGNFSFSVGLGTISLRASSPGFSSPETQSIFIDGDKTINIAVDPNATILSGRCQDNSGTGLAGVIVIATPKAGPMRSGISDPQGYYELSLPAGDWTLTSSLKGFASQSTHKFFLEISKTIQGVDFTLNANRSLIRGRATLSGVGLAGTLIQSGVANTLTDNSGFYFLSVNAGSQTISGTKEGYLFTKRYTLGINPGDTLANIDFVATGNAGIIKGQLTSGGSEVSTALVQATNSATGETFSQSSDAKGLYVFSLPSGDYKITAQKEGFILDQGLNLTLSAAGTILDANLRLFPNQGNISGDVVAGNMGLSGCEVAYLNEVNNSLSGKTISDPQGRYFLSLQSGSRYSLSASCPGYQTTTIFSDTVRNGKKLVLGFNLAKAGAIYHGQVVDTKGSVISAVKVSAEKAGELVSTQSDFNGEYILNLGAGTYSFVFSKTGFSTSARVMQISLGENLTSLPDTLSSSIGKVAGRILSNGSGIPNALITLMGLTPEAGNRAFTSDGEGRFSGENIPSGSYSLSVSANGYAEGKLASLTVIAGQLANAEIQLVQNNGTISGTIKREGFPMTGAMVTANALGVSSSTISDENGKFLIEKLPAATYTITATSVGFSADRIWENQTLSPNAAIANLDFSLSKNTGSLSGTISGAGLLSGIRLSFAGKKGTRAYATSDGSGRYSIPSLASDEYTLTLIAPGYKILGASQNPSVKITQSQELDLVLTPALFKIVGKILDQVDAPIVGLPIEVRSSKTLYKAISGQAGEFLIADVPAGDEYRVAFKPPTAEYDAVDTAFAVDLNVAKEVMVSLRTYSRLASLSGSVKLNGQPLEGAIIRISGNNNFSTVLSQPGGLFKMPGIAGSDKPVAIQIYKAGAKNFDTTLILKPGESKSDIIVDLATLKLKLSVKLLSSEGKLLGLTKILYAHGQRLDTVMTSSEGALELEGITANQNLTLASLLNKNDYDNFEQPVFIKERDSSISITTKVHRSTVEVQVVDASGAQINGAEVLVNGKSVGSTLGGKVQIKGLGRGVYRLAGGKSTYRGGKETVLDLSGDTTLSVTLTLSKIDGGIYGSVIDTGFSKIEDGFASQKLPGAIVLAIFPGDTLRDTVSSLGQFYFTGALEGRKYKVQLILPGYFPFYDSVLTTASAQKIDIVMRPLPGAILGRVESGLAGITINMVHASAGSAKSIETGQGGYYAFLDLQNQSDYVVQAQMGELSSQAIPLQASASISKRVDLKLENWGSGLGVVQGPGAIPLRGVLVTARNSLSGAKTYAITDSLGQFKVRGLPPGKFDFIAERKGYTVSNSISVTLGQKTIQENINFSLDDGASGITGIVVNENEQSLQAEVFLISGLDTLKVNCDEGGHFLFSGRPAGNYQLSASKLGFASTGLIPINFAGKGLINQNLILIAEKNQISGIVRDAFTHHPLTGVLVKTAMSPFVTAISDSLGQIKIVLPNLSASPMILNLSKEGYITKTQIPVYLDKGGTAAQDFVLAADYQFNGEISLLVKESKDTIPGLFVTVEPFFASDSLKFSLTGKVPNSFRGLRWPAPYTLRVKRDGYKDLTKVVELTAKAPILNVVLAYPNSQIKVFVTSNGLSGKSVELSLNGLPIKENTDTVGLFISGGKLKPSNYEVAIKDAELNLIPFAPYFISLGEDSIHTDSLPAPFLSVPIVDSIIGMPFSVKVARSDSLKPMPSVTCKLFFRRDVDPIWKSIELDSIKGGFSGILPEQLFPGTYLYYHELVSPFGARILVETSTGKISSFSQVRYSDRQSPGQFILRDPYILNSIALNPQRLESDTSLYSLGAKDQFQVLVRGENGRDLNAFFDEKSAKGDTNFTVTWKFSSPDYASSSGLSLSSSPQLPRLANFSGGNRASDSIFKATCSIRMGSVKLSKVFFIRIEDLRPISIGIKLVKENRELEENGAELVLSNQSIDGYPFSAFAKTVDGRVYNIAPRWSFGADSVIGSLSQRGLFRPNSSIARGAVLTIYDTLPIGLTSEGETLHRAFQFSTNLQSFAQVIPGDKGLTRVSDGAGTTLDFNLAGLSKSFTVSVKKPKVSGLLRSSPQQEVVGDILDIDLSESQPFKADSGAVLKMPIREGIARKATVYLGHWNSKRLVWEKVDSTKSDTVVDGKVNHFSKYAVLMGSLPLGAYDFTFAPNPFSAQDPWGLQMSYKVSSDISSQVGIRLEVYNMMGDKVYESHEFQLSKGDVIKPGLKKAGLNSPHRRDALGPYVWDGHDSKGIPCRNGRYMVKLIVKDGKGTKSYLKTVVMLK